MSVLRGLAVVALPLMLGACGSTVDVLGKEASAVAAGSGGSAGSEAAGGGSGAGAGGAGGAGAAGDSGGKSYDSSSLLPLTGPASYPNAFADLLGMSAADIDDKVEAAFEQLFYGDPAEESVYFLIGDDQAFILDVLHGDVRSEGLGLGMMIALQLNRRDEFDRLWSYAHASLEYASGPQRGYFRSTCERGLASSPCVDPFGQQVIATALLLAHGRFGSQSGTIDYGAEALRLLDVMRSREAENGGVVDGVTDMFDDESALVLDVPEESAAGTTRPSIVMPAYYELWAQATGDTFWTKAAASARVHLEAAAEPTNGLLPLRATFDGEAVSGSDTFAPGAYRALFNMTLDYLWSGEREFYTVESDRLLGFFYSHGLTQYCSSYTLDGVCLAPYQHSALIAMNGVTALASTHSEREAFVRAVWDAEIATGTDRYYGGLSQLLALLTLSGQFRVY